MGEVEITVTIGDRRFFVRAAGKVLEDHDGCLFLYEHMLHVDVYEVKGHICDVDDVQLFSDSFTELEWEAIEESAADALYDQYREAREDYRRGA